MKRLPYFIAALLLAISTQPAFAQYNEVKQQATGANRPYTDIPILDGSQPTGVTSNGEARGRQLFNFGWRYAFGPHEGAEQENYDDSAWRQLDLPHDFQFEQPWVEEEIGRAHV